MLPLSKNKVGMVVGVLYGLFHFSWVLLVALGWAKPLMDWILSLHFMTIDYVVTEFNFLTGIGLIVFTFVVGYITGWVLAFVWNRCMK
jgi:hypothetical protein